MPLNKPYLPRLLTLQSLALALSALSLAGCQSASHAGMLWESQALRDRVKEVRKHNLAGGSPRVTADVEVKDGSMQALVDLAVAHNPEVAAGRLRIERMREHPAQAGALEDPELSLTVGELPQTAAGQVDLIVGLTQKIPYPGTLKTRASLAEHHVLTAATELLDDIERVAAEVRRVYWRRYGTARAIEVNRQDKQVLQQISETIDARARVGESGQADQLRVSLRLSELEQQHDRLTQEMRSLDAMMNRLLNRRVDAPLPVPEVAAWEPRELDRDHLIAKAERENPAVQVRRRLVEQYRHRFMLAKVERRPDFRIGVQYSAVGSDGLAGSANGEDQFALTGAVTLPLNSDKYDAMEREALRGIGETLAELDAAQGAAANAAEDALARMDAEAAMLTRLNEQMLPDSRRAFELSLAGYRAGNVSFIQMMDDWQRTLDLELAMHRGHARYEQAYADLAAALGDVSGQMVRAGQVRSGDAEHE